MILSGCLHHLSFISILLFRLNRSILSIQCMIRGKLARLRARRLYNPHNRMGYAALTDLLHQTGKILPPLSPYP